MKEDTLTIVDTSVKKFGNSESSLIPILQEIEKHYGFLPEEDIACLSKTLRVPASRIYGVITFYSQFHLQKRGRHIIWICRGTACHVRGSKTVLDSIKELLEINDGETTSDGIFTLETVACLGTCALAPVMLIDKDYYGNLTPKKIEKILKKYTEGGRVEA